MLKLTNIYQELLTETVERNKIIKAIEDKRLVTIYYESPFDADKPDYVKGWRRIEPFCYGINQYDNAVLRAWEVHGVSYSYPPGKNGSNGGKVDPLTYTPGWRMFRIDGIKTMNETGNDRFTSPRPKYNPNDKDMKIIFKAATFGSNSQAQQVAPTGTPTSPATPQSSTTSPFSKQPSTATPTPSTSTTSSTPTPDTSSTPSWFTKFGNKFKNIVNFGKNDKDKI